MRSSKPLMAPPTTKAAPTPGQGDEHGRCNGSRSQQSGSAGRRHRGSNRCRCGGRPAFDAFLGYPPHKFATRDPAIPEVAGRCDRLHRHTKAGQVLGVGKGEAGAAFTSRVLAMAVTPLLRNVQKHSILSLITRSYPSLWFGYLEFHGMR